MEAQVGQVVQVEVENMVHLHQVEVELLDKEITVEMEVFPLHNMDQVVVAVEKLLLVHLEIQITHQVEMDQIFLQLLDHNTEQVVILVEVVVVQEEQLELHL
jgi:hypothetical protein